MTSKPFNIANAISIFRACTAIPIVHAIHNGDPIVFLWIAIAVFSDWLDGFIARHYNLITPLGCILDPIADFIVLSSVMTWFYLNHWVSGWLWWLMFVRYSSIFLAVVIFLQNEQQLLKSNFYGKCSVCIASVYGIAILCDMSIELVMWLEWILALCLIISWWAYFNQYLRPKFMKCHLKTP